MRCRRRRSAPSRLRAAFRAVAVVLPLLAPALPLTAQGGEPEETTRTPRLVVLDFGGAPDLLHIGARLAEDLRKVWEADPLPQVVPPESAESSTSRGSPCNTVGCALQRGRALGADYVVGGRVSRRDNGRGVATAWLVEVKGGRPLRAVWVERPTPEALDREAARELVGHLGRSLQAVAMETGRRLRYEPADPPLAPGGSAEAVLARLAADPEPERIHLLVVNFFTQMIENVPNGSLGIVTMKPTGKRAESLTATLGAARALRDSLQRQTRLHVLDDAEIDERRKVVDLRPSDCWTPVECGLEIGRRAGVALVVVGYARPQSGDKTLYVALLLDVHGRLVLARATALKQPSFLSPTNAAGNDLAHELAKRLPLRPEYRPAAPAREPEVPRKPLPNQLGIGVSSTWVRLHLSGGDSDVGETQSNGVVAKYNAQARNMEAYVAVQFESVTYVHLPRRIGGVGADSASGSLTKLAGGGGWAPGTGNWSYFFGGGLFVMDAQIDFSDPTTAGNPRVSESLRLAGINGIAEVRYRRPTWPCNFWLQWGIGLALTAGGSHVQRYEITGNSLSYADVQGGAGGVACGW